MMIGLTKICLHAEQSLPLRPEEIQQIMKLKQELDTEILYKRKELDMVNQRLILTNQLMQQLEQIWSQSTQTQSR